MANITRGERNVQWIQKYLKIPDGPNYGKPLILTDWQRKLVLRIYDNPVRTRMAIMSYARKNAKSALAAVLGLLHFIGPESKQNAKLYTAARTREQASITYEYARQMVVQNKELHTITNIVRSRKEMECAARGTLFKALAAEASGNYGLNPSMVVHDELGQVRGPYDEMYEALESAMGAQDAPLSVVISTQASTDDDLLSTLIDDALAGHDPSRICELYTAEGIEDPFTIQGLEAANPGMYEFMNADELINNMKQAKRLPSKRVSFMNLNLNMRVEVNDPFLSRDVWDACRGELPSMNECEALYAGLDLSRTRDLTAFVVVGVKDDKYYVYPTFWLPSQGLRDRSETEKIPYFQWSKLGYINATPGSIIDRQYASDYIYSVYESTKLEKIAYDAWDYKHIIRNLAEAGFPTWQVDPDEGDKDEMLFEMFRQGFYTMSPALRTAEQLIVEKKLVHGNNPVLNFNIANAKVVQDTAGNRKLDKSSSTKTIDGAVAMIMALSIAYREHGEDEHGADVRAITEMLD